MNSKDCLLLGFYDFPFPEYVEMVRTLGEDSGAYRDLALAFIEHEGKTYRALDILSKFFNEGRNEQKVLFHNADFLWPVITYLTTYLKRNGLEVDYVNLPHLQMDELKIKLTSCDIRSVVITTTLYVSPQPIINLISIVRKINPKVKIIVGGPYISNQVKALPRTGLTRLLSNLGADIYVLCQEGEATLATLLKAIRDKGVLNFIPNLAFFSNEKQLTYTLEHPESNHLSENMVDYEQFSVKELGEFITTRTAKSCPFACSFCGFPARAGEYTYLDVAHVEKEFDAIAERNQVTTVTILDDTFNVPKARFKEILRMMIKNQYPFKWNSFYRSDHGDEEVIELMARAGCEGVFLGVESGSDAILARMNKTARRKHYLQAIPAFMGYDISTYVSLIVGFPGETDDTVQETIEFLEEAKPEFYRAQLWYADPVTPIWKDREKYGVVGQGFHWKHDTMDSQRACDWIEKMLLLVNNSIWLPQFGFEQWSTFYLQRKGMSRGRIREFLRTFDAVIKHRLVSYGRPPESDLVAALRESCQFHEKQVGESVSIQRWSGETYRLANEALALELKGTRPSPVAVGKTDIQLKLVAEAMIDGSLGSWLCRCESVVRDAVLLATYAAVTKRLRGNQLVLAALSSAGSQLPIPMNFQSIVDDPLSCWMREAFEKVNRLKPYAHFALSICDDPQWRVKYGIEEPWFGSIFQIVRRSDDKGHSWVQSLLSRRGLSDLMEIELDQERVTCSIYTNSEAQTEVLRTQLGVFVNLLGSHAIDSQKLSSDWI